MAKKRKIIGTGITTREIMVYDGVDAIQALHELSARWTDGGQFAEASFRVIQQCRQIIATARVKPHEPDSRADFAERILRSHRIAQVAIERNDPDKAALAAYEFGVLVAEAKLKWRWERHALRGEKNDLALKEGAHAANKKRIDDAKQRHADWQVRANKFWAGNKRLSASEVAHFIANDTGDNWQTIRRKISCKN